MIQYLKSYKGIALMLFLFVFIYLLLRALYTAPLHDEIATYFFYIYHGEFIQDGYVFDANNHFLNSFLGYGIKRLFGDSFFLLRLPNLLAFPIYFWAIYQLLKGLADATLRVITLAAVTTIPFILEYFAYTRGYGLGMAFLFLGIKWGLDYVRTAKTWLLITTYLSCWLAIFSNFVFLNPILIFIGYLIVNQLMTRKHLLQFSLITVLFGGATYPFVFLILKLKEHGALYYGSLDGLWDVTGKSLAKMVFFLETDLFMWPILVLLIGLIAAWILLLKKNRFQAVLKSPLFFFGFLLFGSIALILFLALALKVNYPEDRTGMYLIPLCLLLFAFSIAQSNQTLPLKWLLVYFPLAFLFQISLQSSIYSPDQRMSRQFYEKVKKELDAETTICSYHMNIWTWNFHESNHTKKSSALVINTQDSPCYDIILGKKNTVQNKEVFKDFDTIAFDPLTSDVAFKRKVPIKKTLKQVSKPANTWADWEYVSIFETDSLDHYNSSVPLQVSAEFVLKTFEPKSNIQLVFQLFDDGGNEVERVFYPIGLVYRNQKIHKKMTHNVIFPNFSKEVKVLKVYLWNKDLEVLEIKNVKCYLYELN